jgi:hypothetical protein
MSFVSEIEVVFATRSVKWCRVINETDRVIYVVFVAELRDKLICESVVSHGRRLYI